MLTRAFRLTDKFSNAFLKIAVWLSQWLLMQVTNFRESVEASVVGFYRGTTRTIDTVTQGSKSAYGATDQGRRSLMAQRAAMTTTGSGSMQPTIIEDPLIRQNRTLSLFTVLLLLALIAVVLWATNQDNGGTRTANDNGGAFIPGQNTDIPTVPNIPTQAPTLTPVPQPLNWRGTLVFSVRENGQEDIFAMQRGDSQPRRLTNSPTDERDPTWSPDGRSIAYVTNKDGAWEIYVMDILTRQQRRITFSPGYVGSPSWSPDGTFIVYEAYINNNLDIYISSIDQSGPCGEPCPVTSDPGPDFEPEWMPQLPDGSGGRMIAYTSIRAGEQDIYLISLDNPNDSTAINITNTPLIDENYATWTPDATRLAYSLYEDGRESVFYRDMDITETEDGAVFVNFIGTEVAVGRGRMPVWNPQDGSSLFYSADRNIDQSQIIGADPNTLGGGGDVQIIDGLVSDLDWVVSEPTFESVLASYQPLFEENAQAGADGRFGLAEIPDVDTIDPVLNSRVDDSYNALRFRVFEETGIDYLGELEDAFWRLDRLPEQGQPRENWHYAGRSIALNRNMVLQGNPTPMVVVREDSEVGVYWRVYLRTNAQNGTQGEPIRQVPWDFAARTTDIAAYEQGGKRLDNIPSGYYVDLTKMAQDYEWLPLPADRTWRQNFAGILFWELVKTDDLTWRAAMRELYTDEEIEALGQPPVEATSTLPILPTPTDLPAATPTPIPPDQQ